MSFFIVFPCQDPDFPVYCNNGSCARDLASCDIVSPPPATTPSGCSNQ